MWAGILFGIGGSTLASVLLAAAHRLITVSAAVPSSEWAPTASPVETTETGGVHVTRSPSARHARPATAPPHWTLVVVLLFAWWRSRRSGR